MEMIEKLQKAKDEWNSSIAAVRVPGVMHF
jgi:hypothetical protein